MSTKIALFIIVLLQALCAAAVSAQQQGPRFFHYHEIAGHLKELRKGALEYVAVTGDNTPEGDQRIIDTLRMFLGKNTLPGTSGLWPNYHGVVKNLQIRKAGWHQLPEELSSFRHLFELTFIQCPHITLQSINDQMKARRDRNDRDDLYRKFKNDIVSISFSDTDFASQDSCHLEVELLEELSEIRFVRIGNLNHACENLLTELNRAYPALGWLTIESCKLDDVNSLLPLRGFKKLKSVSLSRNYLTKIPAVPESLRAMDLSYNFLTEFPSKTDSNSLRELEFLYLECNLFDYFELHKVLSDTLVDRMEVFSYDPCNFERPDELKLISDAFDKRKVAVYMPFVERYHNDFSVAAPDCLRCQPHRDAFIDALLHDVVFQDSTGAENHVSFESNAYRMQLRPINPVINGPGNRVLVYRQLKSCIKDFADPGNTAQVWDWQLCFWVEDMNSMDNQFQKLVLLIKDKTGKMDWQAFGF